MTIRRVLAVVAAASLPAGAVRAQDLGQFRKLVTEWVTAPAGPERDAVRKQLEPFAKSNVRDLEAAVRKGFAVTATSEKDALRKGEVEDHIVLVDGFACEALGRKVTYAVGLPPGYDPGKRWPLVLDPGHGAMKTREERLQNGQTGVYLRAIEGKGAIFMRTNLLSSFTTEDEYDSLLKKNGAPWFAAIFEACVRDAMTRFAIDPDRLYVVGVSQTAFFAWQLAALAPWRWAGVMPAMGVLNDAKSSLPNCVGLPLYVLTGEKDTVVSPEQGRAAASALRRLGSEVEYEEVKGGDHGAWIQHCGAGIRWILDRKRGPIPKRIAFAVERPLPWNGAFLRVDEVEPATAAAIAARPDALVNAAIDGQTVRITTDDVKRLTLYLSDTLVDLDKPVVVEWNGKKVHDGPLARSLDVLLESLAERVDTARPFTAKLDVR
ncbi:MAG: hypothetical protein HYR85_15935 [Planctomycetes bacterium]|nr:hypothetical protein [Planctomycetota bacterium]MBI3846239.1 hypothetical protein [Planctomycetota bacterium]